MHKNWKTLVASACVAAFAVPAFAQTAPQRPPEGARPWHGPQGPQGQAGPRGFSKPSERVDAMLAYQRTALKITDAQQSQWNAYAEQVRKEARDMDQRMEAMRAQAPGARPGHPPQRPGAIEGLERRQAMHAEAIRRINDRLAVQKPLYAALSPDQQKIADMVLNGRGHMAMAHMGARGGQGHFGGGMGPERGMRGPMMRGEGGMPGPMFGALEGEEGMAGMHEPMARGFTRS